APPSFRRSASKERTRTWERRARTQELLLQSTPCCGRQSGFYPLWLYCWWRFVPRSNRRATQRKRQAQTRKKERQCRASEDESWESVESSSSQPIKNKRVSGTASI